MTGGWNEVYTAMHSGVWDPLLPVNVDFLLQVFLILVIDELHDGLPAVQKDTWTGELEVRKRQDHPLGRVLMGVSRSRENDNNLSGVSP